MINLVYYIKDNIAIIIFGMITITILIMSPSDRKSKYLKSRGCMYSIIPNNNYHEYYTSDYIISNGSVSFNDCMTGEYIVLSDFKIQKKIYE